MRHLLLALLIALLPLRAWMGDAMAVSSMLASPAHASMAMAHQSGAEPCPDHAVDAHDMAATPSADADHPHNACDICNGPAMTLPVQATPVLSAARSHHLSPTERFASSVPTPGIKPPIS